MSRLTKIEGIGESYASRLREAGIPSQEKLLERCCNPQDRKRLAELAGVSEKRLLEWINRADLARVRGVGEEYSDLLEHSGVDTVRELAQRRAEHLHQKMLEVNQARRFVRHMPSLKQVQGWIEQAKKLPRMINY